MFQVLRGPEGAALNGETHLWWQVREERYEPSPATGWVAEDFLEEVSPGSLVPGSPPQYFVSAQDWVEEKVQWAESMVGDRTWYDPKTGMTYCLGFVAQTFTGQQTTDWVCPGDPGHSCPNGGKQKLLSEGKFYQAGECWNPPRGALVFFSNAPIDGVYYGHIGICLGDGKVVHVPAEGAVRINTIAEVIAESYIYSYDGWAYPPEEWMRQSAAGGVRLVLQAKDVADLPPDQASGIVDRSTTILRQRMDQYGLANVEIRPMGKDRIEVKIPGEADPEEELQLGGRRGQTFVHKIST